MSATKLTCDGERDCGAPVTHVDRKGYVYCTAHGARRKTSGVPCRKLTAAEIGRLERGETISYTRTRAGSAGTYCTSYCNHAHDVATGRPIGHECYVLPSAALVAEREGRTDDAIAAIEAAKPLRRHAGSRSDSDMRRAAVAAMIAETSPFRDVWLCSDCTIAQCNGDYSGMSEERAAEVSAAFERFARAGTELSVNDDPETGEGRNDFSHAPCDCCGSRLAGNRTRFALWAKRGAS